MGEGKDVLLEKQVALRAMQASLSNHLRDAYDWHSSPTHTRTLLRHADWLGAIGMRFYAISGGTFLSSLNSFLSKMQIQIVWSESCFG